MSEEQEKPKETEAETPTEPEKTEVGVPTESATPPPEAATGTDTAKLTEIDALRREISERFEKIEKLLAETKPEKQADAKAKDAEPGFTIPAGAPAGKTNKLLIVGEDGRTFVKRENPWERYKYKEYLGGIL